jgi:single-stranded DNA-binding protein
MARDINEVILTGTVCTEPTPLTFSNGTRICIFSLRVIEKYVLASRKPAQHINDIKIEVLGPKADQTASEVRIGDRYIVKGYLRVDEIDGKREMRVRAFRVEAE